MCAHNRLAFLCSEGLRPSNLPGCRQEHPQHRVAEGSQATFEVLKKANPLTFHHPLPKVPPRLSLG